MSEQWVRLGLRPLTMELMTRLYSLEGQRGPEPMCGDQGASTPPGGPALAQLLATESSIPETEKRVTFITRKTFWQEKASL